MPPPDSDKGRPRREAALTVENPGDGFDVASLPRPSDGGRPKLCRRSAAVALCTLRPADRRRLIERLADLEELARLARQRGTLAAGSEPST